MGIEDLDDLIKDINSALLKVFINNQMTKMNNKYNYKKFSENSPLMIFVHGAGCDNTFWALLNRYYFLRDIPFSNKFTRSW